MLNVCLLKVDKENQNWFRTAMINTLESRIIYKKYRRITKYTMRSTQQIIEHITQNKFYNQQGIHLHNFLKIRRTKFLKHNKVYPISLVIDFWLIKLI